LGKEAVNKKKCLYIESRKRITRRKIGIKEAIVKKIAESRSLEKN
jgi:hypothetical protein